MIGDVRISNWKRHRNFEHSFDAGLNFILGANGKGKTSLIQAVRFGLFGPGDIGEARESIRFDASSASVQVALSGDKPVIVGRSINSRGRVTETLSAASAASVSDVLRQHFGADPGFLRSLVFLSEGDIYSPQAGSTGLEQQLESLLPIRGLSALLGEIRTARGPLIKEQRSRRNALQMSRDELAQLAQDEARHRAELERLRGEEGELQERYLTAVDRARVREQWMRQQTERAAWQRRVSDFAAEASLPVVGDGIDSAIIELDRRREECEERLRSLAERRGALDGRIAAIKSFLEDLDQTDDDLCPLCRQSLDDNHRSIALAEHGDEMDKLITLFEQLKVLLADGQVDLDRSREAIQGARRLLAERPAELATVEIPPEDADAQLESARNAVDGLRAHRALREEQLLEIRERLATAEASRRLEEQVTAAFHDDALLEATETGVRDFLADLRRSVMMPLAEQLSLQWKAYRPDAEWSIALDDAGGICLARAGATRPFSALSGGEKTVATVLLRVALLTALTTSDVVVLDEPLEHLDPRARRLMISSLHQVVRKGFLKQILISTYEESLVRRLLTHEDVQAVWID